MKFSIGFATDIHNLTKNNKKPLILGGFIVPKNSYSIIAHSDGDLILHAIASSILGAMNSHITIGQLFDDQDKKNKNMDSKIIINTVLKMLKKQKSTINNIDISITCEQIMLKDYLLNIKKSLQAILKTKNIGIKCTRFEDKKNMQIKCNVICSIK